MFTKFVQFFLALVILSMSAYAGNTPQLSSLNSFGGGLNSAGPGKSIPRASGATDYLLTASVLAGTTAHYLVLYDGNGNQMSLATGKTLKCAGFWMASTLATDGFQMVTGTGTWSDDAAGAPSGVIYSLGSSGKVQFKNAATTPAIYNWYPIPIIVRNTSGVTQYLGLQDYINSGGDFLYFAAPCDVE
jgi:hypothetical protein